MIDRDPDAPAGACAGTADLVGLLDNQDIFGAHFPIAQRRGQRTVAGAHNQHINFFVPFFSHKTTRFPTRALT